MYSDFEQDLILACKCHYGEKGIEKVIRDYIGYSENQEVKINSIYHFISDLYIKMVENNHLRLYSLLVDQLSPNRIYDKNHTEYVYNRINYSLYDFPKILCDHMIGEIQGVQVIKDGKVLIELHEKNKKFKDKKDCETKI
jgi:hypothetical protein